jgi:hypothetical protein
VRPVVRSAVFYSGVPTRVTGGPQVRHLKLENMSAVQYPMHDIDFQLL